MKACDVFHATGPARETLTVDYWDRVSELPPGFGAEGFVGCHSPLARKELAFGFSPSWSCA